MPSGPCTGVESMVSENHPEPSLVAVCVGCWTEEASARGKRALRSLIKRGRRGVRVGRGLVRGSNGLRGKEATADSQTRARAALPRHVI